MMGWGVVMMFHKLRILWDFFNIPKGLFCVIMMGVRRVKLSAFGSLHFGLGKTFRSSHRRCSIKKGVLKISANFTGKHLCWCLFLIKLKACRPTTLSTQAFSCEICKIFKNTYFEEHLLMAVTEHF